MQVALCFFCKYKENHYFCGSQKVGMVFCTAFWCNGVWKIQTE